MDFPTQNGLIGAACGLVLGAIDFAILSRVLETVPRNRRAMTPQARQLVMRIVGVTSFFAMPVAGYVVGEVVLP